MTRAGILVLTLILALGSIYQPVLQLAHGTKTLVELCIDGQAQKLAVGPDGRPVPHASHDCDDCLLSPSVGLNGHSPVAAHAPLARAMAFLPWLSTSQRGTTLAASHARAPPAFV